MRRSNSALDPKTTLSILKLLKKLNQDLGLTIVIITHEMQVVKEICNKVAVMEAGRIIEQGDIVSIFSNPQNALTRDFINTATHVEQTLEKLALHPSLVHLKDNDILCKISYIGDSTSEPVISALTARYRVTTNLLFANVEILQQTPIGNLIVVMSGAASDLEAALQYLQAVNLTVEMIDSRLLQNSKVGDPV